MPASQAASRTPGTTSMSGSFTGANGEVFAAAFAITLVPPFPGDQPPTLLLLPRQIEGRLHAGIDILDFGLCAQIACDLLRLLVDDGGHDAVLDRVERHHLAGASVIDLEDVPAELCLERLAHLALLQLEGHLFELRHHLALGEV